jgi:hypothetical protein
MAKIVDWTPKQEAAWAKWVDSRPKVIQDLAERIPPNRLYLLKSSGHRVIPYSYSEDGTLTVAVLAEYNAVAFERRVFGISPDDLEECDLPEPGEILGSCLTQEELGEALAKGDTAESRDAAIRQAIDEKVRRSQNQ